MIDTPTNAEGPPPTRTPTKDGQTDNVQCHFRSRDTCTLTQEHTSPEKIFMTTRGPREP